jgi:hypothetical protein
MPNQAFFQFAFRIFVFETEEFEEVRILNFFFRGHSVAGLAPA